MSNTSVDRARERGRGREADGPLQIPVKGWKDILVRTFAKIGKDRVTLIAAGVTYFLLLAIFPSITAVVSIYGLVADPLTVNQNVAALSSILPTGALNILDEQLTMITTQGTPTLGFALIVSLALALWSASAGIKSMFEAMNIAYDETEKRNFFQLSLLGLVFTVGGVIAAIAMFGTVIAIPLILGIFGFGTGLEWLVQIGSYVVLVAILFAGIAALYRFGPSRQQAKWRWVTPGAALSVAVVIIVSLLFSWYAANFANYDKTYGSLGALIGLLTWIWISVMVVIVGAELDSELEHQTAKDSTIGAPAPLGEREAMMADTVGKKAGTEKKVVDPFALSEDWQAGYAKGLRDGKLPQKRLPLQFALPLATLLGSLRRR